MVFLPASAGTSAATNEDRVTGAGPCPAFPRRSIALQEHARTHAAAQRRAHWHDDAVDTRDVGGAAAHAAA